MTEKNIVNRRRTLRKKVLIPIKFVVKDDTSLTGEVVNINCYGIKFHFLFNEGEEIGLISQTLANQNMLLEIEALGGKKQINTSVTAKWNVCTHTDTRKLYDVGLQLELDEAQQHIWQQFYEGI